VTNNCILVLLLYYISLFISTCVIKYCITFVAFMAIGASVTAIALRRYRR